MSGMENCFLSPVHRQGFAKAAYSGEGLQLLCTGAYAPRLTTTSQSSHDCLCDRDTTQDSQMSANERMMPEVEN